LQHDDSSQLSQDSQDELEESGVAVQEIKRNVIIPNIAKMMSNNDVCSL